MAKLAAELSANGDGRAQVITLALVLGALEASTPQGRLAATTAPSQSSQLVSSADYLRWLANNGYPGRCGGNRHPGQRFEGVFQEFCS